MFYVSSAGVGFGCFLRFAVFFFFWGFVVFIGYLVRFSIFVFLGFLWLPDMSRVLEGLELGFYMGFNGVRPHFWGFLSVCAASRGWCVIDYCPFLGFSFGFLRLVTV